MVRLLSELLLSPASGPARGVGFVLNRIKDQVEAEYLDEGSVKADLLDLEMRYEHGELDEEQYKQQEAAILEHLNEIRAYKESLAQENEVADEG